MASQIDHDSIFDRPAADVAGLYASPDFCDYRNRCVGAWNLSPVESDTLDGRIVVSQSMNMKAAIPLPAFAQRVIGNAVRVTQHYEWDPLTRTGTLRVTPAMLPILLEGRLQIPPGPTPAQCRVTGHWQVECRIPLVGHKIERLLLDDLRSRLEQEREAITGYVP